MPVVAGACFRTNDTGAFGTVCVFYFTARRLGVASVLTAVRFGGGLYPYTSVVI